MGDNLFEKVDHVSNKVDNLTDNVKSLSKKIDNLNVCQFNNVPSSQDQRQIISRFIQRANKEYLWHGTYEQFKKYKIILIALMISMITLLLVCTILVSCSIKSYSGFTLLENMWFICMVGVLIRICLTKYRWDIHQLISLDIFKELINPDGLPYPGRILTRYILGIIAYIIGVICNLVCVWDGGMAIEYSISITIFEIITFIFSMVVFGYFVIDFYNNYLWMRFMGRNDTNTADVCLIGCITTAHLYEEKEFAKMWDWYK